MAERRCTFKCGDWNCGSYQFNLYKADIDQSGFCDVHYWQGRAIRAEALAQPVQPAQEPNKISTEELIYMTGVYDGKVLEREACAKVAQETICDTHIPTGINIYGTRAAKAIRERGNT
jgi:hypothetical protein